MGKIDPVEMRKLERKGYNGKQLAEHFNCSQSAICQMRKKLKISVVKNVQLENAHQIVRCELDTFGQLSSLNRKALDLINLLERVFNGDQVALSELQKIYAGKGFRYSDLFEVYLKTLSEVRHQLKFQAEIFAQLFSMSEVSKFQDAVLTVIGEESPDVRKRIVQRLVAGNALRQSLKLVK